MQIDQNIFYEEFTDKIDAFDEALKEIKADYTNKELLNEMFRALHTIKGTADLLGMFNVVIIIHKAEDLLDEIRNENAQINDEIWDLFKELKEFLDLSLSNTANGIYDDPTEQNLALQFDKSFGEYLQMAQTGMLIAHVPTVLIIESTTVNRYLIKKVAHDLGNVAIMCDNGIEAMQKIKDNDIDLIFADINSECEKCKLFLEEIKSDILYDHIPVVLLVDYLTGDIQKFAHKIGAKAWLKKPIEINKLTTVLNKLLGE